MLVSLCALEVHEDEDESTLFLHLHRRLRLVWRVVCFHRCHRLMTTPEMLLQATAAAGDQQIGRLDWAGDRQIGFKQQISR